MNILKLTISAAAITFYLATSASALPLPNLGIDLGSQADQVRTICDVYGRCWWVPNYRYRYRYGYGRSWRGGYRGGYRRGYRH